MSNNNVQNLLDNIHQSTEQQQIQENFGLKSSLKKFAGGIGVEIGGGSQMIKPKVTRISTFQYQDDLQDLNPSDFTQVRKLKAMQERMDQFDSKRKSAFSRSIGDKVGHTLFRKS